MTDVQPLALVQRVLAVTTHVALLLLVPPLLLGIINKVKAFFAGRRGPPLLQVYFDVLKLLRKDSVLSTTTTWMFRLGPVAAVTTALVAGLFVPLGGAPSPLSFHGDVLLFAYVLALGRLCTVLSALDTGSAFEGMGASREVTWSCLAEPALFMGMVALYKLSGGTTLSLTALLQHSATGWDRAAGAMALVLAAWCIVLLVENCRIPFDDPNTHLELTMIHEVMVLDHSGPAFGMILYGAAMKLMVMGALVVSLWMPRTGAWPADIGLGMVGLVGVAAAVGVVESSMARLRLTRVPQLLVAAIILGVFGVILMGK